MKKIVITTVAALLVLAAMVGVRAWLTPAENTVTVMFPSTTNLYQGAKVKVLGVPVGRVDSITVDGTQVKVVMSYSEDVKLPADVHAVIVPPSVVGDRFVQLAPAYTTGPVLADGAELGVDRAGVPLELDDTYRALDQLSTDLGPNGANKSGALSDLISAAAANLNGRGALFNTSVRELADAIGTLASSGEDFQATTTHLARINTELAGDDPQIRRLVRNLVAVSTTISSQGDTLGDAITTLDSALGRIATFTRSNRRVLHGNLADLTSLSTLLARHSRELKEITDLAPVGLVNLMKTYVPRNWDLNDRSASSVNGRTGSQNLHAVLLQDLDNQLSYLLSSACAQMPADAAAQLSPLCTALRTTGGSLGTLLADVYHQGGTP